MQLAQRDDGAALLAHSPLGVVEHRGDGGRVLRERQRLQLAQRRQRAPRALSLFGVGQRRDHAVSEPLERLRLQVANRCTCGGAHGAVRQAWRRPRTRVARASPPPTFTRKTMPPSALASRTRRASRTELSMWLHDALPLSVRSHSLLSSHMCAAGARAVRASRTRMGTAAPAANTMGMGADNGERGKRGW